MSEKDYIRAVFEFGAILLAVLAAVIVWAQS